MKAIGLVSGGIDSALAVWVMKQQGIEVIALHFLSPFWGKGETAKKMAQASGVTLREVEVGEDYFTMLKNPRYGYGTQMNPCIDCKIWMLRQAKAIMEAEGASFVFTGEVLGQRPKSQMRNTLRLIEKESGLAGFLVRPLSAKLLPPTVPEERGWIIRESLLDVSGRGRSKQLELAQAWGVQFFSPPAGGCLLTEPNFARRLRDLLRSGETWNRVNIELLKIGRHFRLTPSFKLIVGRNEEENERLKAFYHTGDLFLFPLGGKGPCALGRGIWNLELEKEAASLVARYVRSFQSEVVVGIRDQSGERTLTVHERMSESVVKRYML